MIWVHYAPQPANLEVKHLQSKVGAAQFELVVGLSVPAGCVYGKIRSLLPCRDLRCPSSWDKQVVSDEDGFISFPSMTSFYNHLL